MSHRTTLFRHQFTVTAVTDSDNPEFVRGQLDAVCATIVGGARAATLYGNGIVSVKVEPVLWTKARKIVFGGFGLSALVIAVTYAIIKIKFGH